MKNIIEKWVSNMEDFINEEHPTPITDYCNLYYIVEDYQDRSFSCYIIYDWNKYHIINDTIQLFQFLNKK